MADLSKYIPYTITIHGESRVLYSKQDLTDEMIDMMITRATSEIKWKWIKRTYENEWNYIMDHFGFRTAHDVRIERVIWFSEQMVSKLSESRNEAKGLWDDCDIYWLLERMNDEVAELFEAIQQGNREEIIREAADVANFAMMVADVARRVN